MESDALNDTVHPVVNKCLNRSGDCLLSWSQIWRTFVRTLWVEVSPTVS
jgi:hypothetical protein